jgi:hypothetical protein
LPADSDFAGGNPRLPQAYEQAWLACRLIAGRVGAAGLVRFYRQVSAAARSVPATAVAAGLRATLRLSVPSFTAVWQAALRQELR